MIGNAQPKAALSFVSHDDPFALFAKWLKEAEKTEPSDHNAMSLASVDADGMPNVRMVLLKHFDERGFVFYTNLESQKGAEILGHTKAALCFYWKSMSRQIRIRGNVSVVSDEEADAYHALRARRSQIGAWASRQSKPLESRFALEKAVAKYAVKYAIGSVPRPKYWSGLRVEPIYIEFWYNRPFRLHDRIAFQRDTAGDGWSKTRLYP